MITISHTFSEMQWRSLYEKLSYLVREEMEFKETTLERLILDGIFKRHFGNKKIPTDKRTITFKLEEYYSLWSLDLVDITDAHQILLKAFNERNAELLKAGVLIRKTPEFFASDAIQQYYDERTDIEETYKRLSIEKIEGIE